MAVEGKLGFSGGIAKRFQDSKITPLLALTGLLMGLFAVAVTPREEEPGVTRGINDDASLNQHGLHYEGLDLPAYQTARLAAFVAMLRHLEKMPVKG